MREELRYCVVGAGPRSRLKSADFCHRPATYLENLGSARTDLRYASVTVSWGCTDMQDLTCMGISEWEDLQELLGAWMRVLKGPECKGLTSNADAT